MYPGKKMLLVAMLAFCLINMSNVLLVTMHSNASIRTSDEHSPSERNQGEEGNSQSMESRIVGIEDPEADAGGNQTVVQGAEVIFNGSGSSDDFGIDNYTWNFTDGGARILYEVGPTYTFDNAGVFVVTLNVTDAAGNYHTDTMTVTVTVTVNDTTKPVANAGADQTVGPGTLVTFDGSGSTDNVGVDNYTWTFTDGGVQTLYEVGPTHTFNNAGTFEVTLNVTDAAGNYHTDTMSVTVRDLTEPKAVINEVPGTIKINGSIVFNASLSEPGEGALITLYQWKLSRFGVMEWNGTGLEREHTFQKWGIYEMSLEVCDSANRTDTASVWLLVGNLINFSEIRAELPENGSVLVEFSDFIESYWDGIIDVEWIIEFDSMETVASKVVKVAPGSFGAVNQTYSTSGHYNISLDIRTTYGTFTQTVEVEIIDVAAGDNLAPVAAIEPPVSSVHEHQEITFDGSGSSDPDGGELTYAWDFGDGGTGTESSVKHTYTDVGEYTVTLTVTDVNGSSNSTKIMITVEEDPTYFADEGEPKDWSIEIKEKWNRTYGEYDLDADRDEDGDGIPNYEDGDIDGDSYSNLDEVKKGSDPTDKDSIPTQKKKSEDTNCTLLIVLLVIFGVILLLMIAIYTRGRGGQEQKTVHYTKEEDFF